MNTFTQASLSTMIILAVLCTAIPFLFLIYYSARKKGQFHMSSFWMGMGFYLLFAFVAEGIVNALLFNGLSLYKVLNRNLHPVYYAIYGVILAGVFEETGKWIVLKKCMDKRPGKQNALMLGVGHGGMELIAYGASAFSGNIILALFINSMGMDEYYAKLGLTGEALATQKELVTELIAVTPAGHMIDGLTDVLCFFLQISLTVLIYVSIHNPKRRFFFPLAIVIHVIGYLPTYLSQVGVLTDSSVVLAVMGLVTVAAASYAYRVFHQQTE